MLPWRGSKQTAPLAATWLLLLICHGIRGQPLNDEVVVTIDDIQRLGEAKLDGPTRSYIGNGVGAERTLRDNREAFTRLRFRPQSLVDVSKTNTATTVLGSRVSFPIGFSPSAAHMMADPAGEFGTAQAARDAGTVMILSAMSTTSLEDLRARVPDCILWQQTYIFRNRSLTQSLVRRAAAQGFGAIVVTVDSPVTGQDMGLQNNMFRLPPGLRFANLEASSPGRSFTFDPTSPDFVGSLLSPAATWEDIRWLRTITRLPIVVKGVLTAESARKALEYGAAGVLVSNHGGRQLDGDVASLDALPEVVAAVGSRMEVYLDSGVRSGADAVKALSLGARAVFVGRPAIWGLAYNGKQGVDKVLDILRSGLIRTIQLLGCPDSNDLRAEYVANQAYNAQPLSTSTWKPRDPVIDWIDTQVGF